MKNAGPVPSRGAGPALFRRRAVRFGLGAIVLLAIAAVWAITALQKFITFPRAHPSVEKPAARIAAGGESLWFDIDGARVESWFLPASGLGRAPLLIHAHGNGELIDIQTQSVAALRAAGVGVLLVEYPGYGRSAGDPSEKTVTATFLAAYDWASRDPRVDAAHIIGYGRSLGGGAVAQLAARRPVAALVLESTFASIGDIVRADGIPGWLVVNEFDTRAVLAKYPGPVLILHGTQDGTFPVSHAQALHNASPRSVLHLQACGHNDCPLQWELVLSFLARNGVFTRLEPGVSP
jgi:pimeloyl-ACP methyl ester carboxylesterase